MKIYRKIETIGRMRPLATSLLVLSLVFAVATGAQAADDEALWKRLDITEDGWLDGKELEGGWQKYDADGDNEVTKEEFMAGRAKEQAAATGSPEEDARLFKQLDTSDNRILSGKELEAGNVRTYDANGDGRVTSAEFLRARARLRQGVQDKPADLPGAATANNDKGLMAQAEILSFLNTRLGATALPYAQRQEILKELAEIIKRRGTDFRFDSGSDFYRQAAKVGISSAVTTAISQNYGPPTRQEWLLGDWNLSKIGGVTDSVARDRIIRQNESAVGNVGTLTINANATYVWQYADHTLRGAWRKASAKEMRHQGGDGVVLLKAKTDRDWIVTQNRMTKLKGNWISINGLNRRQVKETGFRPATN